MISRSLLAAYLAISVQVLIFQHVKKTHSGPAKKPAKVGASFVPKRSHGAEFAVAALKISRQGVPRRGYLDRYHVEAFQVSADWVGFGR